MTRSAARTCRIVAYVVLAVAMIAPIVQFQHGTMKNLRRGEKFRQQIDSGEVAPNAKLPKSTKGAIGRWRVAVRQFWAGENIYLTPDDPNRSDEQSVYLHPNMPFTVMLLTPFAYMPVWAMALSFNVLKLFILIAVFLWAVRLADHENHRMGDWLAGLAVLWALLPIVADIQHGNTNIFVLAAIAAHLWLYRRGRDLAAGAALALAICLKMTPALFVLYWLYQRNWKLLVGVVTAMVLFAAVIPAATIGTDRYAELTTTWLDNLIVPGLLKGAWYPVHINQSLPGVASRYLLSGPNGDIFWNPDDNPYSQQIQHGWINVLSLSPESARMVIRLVQVFVVAMMAWAIGWRKLPRNDGRRALHYAVILGGMVILNQRTWDHHATTLLIANMAVWYALAYGRISRTARIAALVLVLLAGPCLWGGGGDVVKIIGKAIGHDSRGAALWADTVEAYGLRFLYFVLLTTAAIVLSAALRKAEKPYADRRQKVFS